MFNKNTSNKSFINMWRELQDDNIENNIFMLELHDESLKDFKLEDLNIDDREKRTELMGKVITECKNNIWFFFREIVRIQNPVAYNSFQKDIGIQQYILNIEELRIIYSYINGVSLLSNIDENIGHKGIKTTIYLLELYSFMFNDEPSVSIIEYNTNMNLYLKYHALFEMNMIILPNFNLLSDIDKCIILSNITERGNVIDNIKGNKKNTFIHIDINVNKEKLFKMLYEMKFNNNNKSHPNIFGYYKKQYFYKSNDDSNYEYIVENIITNKLPKDEILFDWVTEIDISKIYIQ